MDFCQPTQAVAQGVTAVSDPKGGTWIVSKEGVEV